MIEPAPGRLNGHGWEPFYRFVKNPDLAWSDTCAVRIPRDNCPDAHRYRTINVMQVETMEEGRNCTNVWSVGNSRKGSGHFACVDEETECLTLNGWKRYDQVIVGEMAAQFDMNTETLSWGPVEGVSIYQVENEPLVSVDTRNISMRLTPNHRTIVRKKSATNPTIVTADLLKS